jgi:predicted DNA-binding protein with PD1-like motif
MRSHELTLGRSFGVALDHGEDFFAALGDFCRTNRVRQGYEGSTPPAGPSRSGTAAGHTAN